MTNYLLSEAFLCGTGVEIDEVQFKNIVHSNKIIRHIWDVEDSFSLLATSFIELEEYLLNVSVNYYFQKDLQRSSDHFFDDARQTFNLKLISALTASRAYEEQLHRRLSALSEMSGTKTDLKESFSSAFDESLEYRVMYALRNHSLHSQLPLSAITFFGSNLSPSGDIRDEGPSRHRITVDPKITAADFCSSDKIREATRTEVSNLGYKYLDLKFFARGFLARLAMCHDDFRRKTEEWLEASLQELHTAYQKLMVIKGDIPKYIHVYKQDNGEEVEKYYADYTHKSRIRDLRKHWSGLKYIQRGYVSSEIVASKNTYPEVHDTIWISK